MTSCHSSITWSLTEWHSVCWSIISQFNVCQSSRANFYWATEGQRCLGWRTSWRKKWGFTFPMKTSLQQIVKTGRCLGLSLASSSTSWARTVSSGWSWSPLISSRWKYCKEGNFYEVLFDVLAMVNLSALFFGPCFRIFNFDNLVVKVKIKCPFLVWWLYDSHQRHLFLGSWEHLLVLWWSRTYAPTTLSHSKQPRLRFPFQFRLILLHPDYPKNCPQYFHFLMHSIFLSIAIISTSTFTF